MAEKIFKNYSMTEQWWQTPLIPALRSQRQVVSLRLAKRKSAYKENKQKQKEPYCGVVFHI